MSEPWRERLRSGAAHRLPGTRHEHLLLFALLALALLLRGWRLWDLPFMHDEISALLRLRFTSFGDLIAQGVAIDAHPAGIQVFEWLWTGLFGTSEFAVKLPFVLLSVAALLLLYRFAATWTNPTVALLGLAFLGTVQYTVLYGQLARPYAAGLFTTALLADQLTRALGGRQRAWWGVAIAAAACAYTHHFALLLAGIMGLSALSLATPAQRKPLLLAGLGGLLLYAPHLPIFFRQLGYAGVGQWLDPPGTYWLPDHLAWVFQFSVLLAALVALVAVIGWARHRGKGHRAFVWMCLAWWALPLVVGWTYSVWRAPVLQHSVLLFGFPYAVFAVFAGWAHLPVKRTVLMSSGIAVVSVCALVFGRRHFELAYTSKYEASVEQGLAFLEQEPEGLVLTSHPEEIIPFYLGHLGIDPATFPHVNTRDLDAPALHRLLESTSAERAFVGWSNGARAELRAQVRERFPMELVRTDLADGGWAVFGDQRPGVKGIAPVLLSEAAPDLSPAPQWRIDEGLPRTRDTTSSGIPGPARWDFTGREFGLLFEAPLDSLPAAHNDRIEVALHLAGEAPEGLLVAGELLDGDSSVFYRTGDAFPGTDVLITAVELATVEQRGRDLRFRAYVWNRELAPVRVARMSVRVEAGNPVQYGLFERVPTGFP